MSSTETPAILAVMAVMFIMGGVMGYSVGTKSLCRDQFQGEIHKGKCVKVQREEVK